MEIGAIGNDLQKIYIILHLHNILSQVSALDLIAINPKIYQSMKKSILSFLIVVTAFGLVSFGYLNWNDSEKNQSNTTANKDVAINTEVKGKIEKRIFSDFIYDIGPRFSAIKKRQLNTVRSINDFLSREQIQRIVSFKSASIIIFKNEKRSDISESGNTNELTIAQLNLLQSFDYSTNFVISAEYQQKNKETGVLEDSYSTPHLTIVPEKQAKYLPGKDILMEYLKENSKEARANVDPDELQPAKLFFTVTQEGTIENIRLDRSSGYPIVDKTMIELISKAPGDWEPAENAKGEKVNQELVVSFGLMGC